MPSKLRLGLKCHRHFNTSRVIFVLSLTRLYTLYCIGYTLFIQQTKKETTNHNKTIWVTLFQTTAFLCLQPLAVTIGADLT